MKKRIILLVSALFFVLISGCGEGGSGSSSPATTANQTPANLSNGNSSNSTGSSAGANSEPIANAGLEQTVLRGEAAFLDGTASADPDGDPLSHRWSFAYKPTGSTATLNASTIVNPTFVPDLPRSYVVRLIVNDGKASLKCSIFGEKAESATSRKESFLFENFRPLGQFQWIHL